MVLLVVSLIILGLWLTRKANAQDSTMVTLYEETGSIEGWDIAYYVYDKNVIIHWIENPYNRLSNGFKVWKDGVLQGIYMAYFKSGCVTWQPSRMQTAPMIKPTLAGCRIYDGYRNFVQDRINKARSQPLG